MSGKIKFQHDWSNLSDKEILNNIDYLQKNYKKYKIEMWQGDYLFLDNVFIHRETKKVQEGCCVFERTFYTVNNKTYYIGQDVANKLADLYEICEFELMPTKEKLGLWWDYNRVWVSTVFIATMIAAGVIVKKCHDKNKVQEKQKIEQQQNKSAIKTINFKDCVNQKVR